MSLLQKLPKILLSILNGVGVNILLHILFIGGLRQLGRGAFVVTIIYLPVFLPIILICQIVSLIICKALFKHALSWVWSWVGFFSPLLVLGVYLGIALGFNFYTNSILTPDQRNSKYPLVQIIPKIYEYSSGSQFDQAQNNPEINKSDFTLRYISELQEESPITYINKDTKITIQGGFDIWRDKYVEVIDGQYWDTDGTSITSNVTKNITLKKADTKSIEKKLSDIFIEEKLKRGWSLQVLKDQVQPFRQSKNIDYFNFENVKNPVTGFNSGPEIPSWVIGSSSINLSVKDLTPNKSYQISNIKILVNPDYNYNLIASADLKASP
ncbi:MAG: hypothetical protein H7230_04595 [Candidatus Parcubacteria bacterium]|nr:hypothetical protein [Candidatus Paceibacterota bacterium]